MILRYCKKNIYSILAVLGILLIFEPVKNWCSVNWNWFGLFTIVIYGLLSVTDCIIKWFEMNFTIMGKIKKAVAVERKNEREQFGKNMVSAKKIGDTTGNWSLYNSIVEQKNKQISCQNIILFNAWLKREFDREDSLEEEF